MHIVQEWIHSYGYAGLFGLLFTEMLGVPIPVEAALAAAGVAWTNGMFRLLPLLLVACAANIGGATAAYGIGRFAGRQVLLAAGKRFGLREDKFEQAESRFRKYSVPLLLFSRFFLGVRVFVPYLAGINRLPFSTFFFYNSISGIVWVTAYIFFGRTIHHLWSRYRQAGFEHGNVGAAIAGIGLAALLAGILLWIRRMRRRKAAASASDTSAG